jgi:hypothetical protein
MHIPPATHAAAATQISPLSVSAAIRQRANSDGDGRTGTAALNDGDSAAQQAKSSVRSVDIRV